MKIEISKLAKKQLSKLPRYIVDNFYFWVKDVETRGMREVRKTSGYHDEPLKRNRIGQRSVRLSGGYRAIYCERTNEIIEILEVGNHDIY